MLNVDLVEALSTGMITVKLWARLYWASVLDALATYSYRQMRQKTNLAWDLAVACSKGPPHKSGLLEGSWVVASGYDPSWSLKRFVSLQTNPTTCTLIDMQMASSDPFKPITVHPFQTHVQNMFPLLLLNQSTNPLDIPGLR